MARGFQINGEMMVMATFGAHVPPAPASSGTSTTISTGGGSQLQPAALGGGSKPQYFVGLTQDPIHVALTFRHQETLTDAYANYGGGTPVPADLQAQLAYCDVTAKLVHFDRSALELCLREAQGGGADTGGAVNPGLLAWAGTPMGGLTQPPAVPGEAFAPASGYHYVSLTLFAAKPLAPSWRFPASYLAARPVEYPLGTERSVVTCVWRAVPYGVQAGAPATISGGTTSTTVSIQAAQTSYPAAANAQAPFLWDHTPD